MQKRAPKYFEDRGSIYPPRQPLLTPSWDVKLHYQLSFLFTLAMLGLGMLLNIFAGPLIRAWQRRNK